MTSFKSLIIPVFFTMAGIIFKSCVADDDPSSTGSLTVGDIIPHFSVELNDGKTVSDTSLKGKIAIIVFFNTSCPDCREELPVVNNFYLEIKDDESVSLFSISREEDYESVESYWYENNLSIPFSAQSDRTVYNLFAKSIIPRIYFVNSAGIITATFGDSDMPTLQTLETTLEFTRLY